MPDLLVVHIGLHPWVGANIGHRRSILAVVAEQFQDEVLEIVGKILPAGLLPVGVIVTLKEQVVEIFILLGLLEREDALDDDEEDDAGGEHVDLHAVVRFALLDLGGHVSHGSPIRFEIVYFSKSCKTKIGDFQVHQVINQDIFKLQVPVHDALAMHVLQHVAHLVQEEAAAVLAHATQVLAHVEKETTGHEFQKNVN